MFYDRSTLKDFFWGFVLFLLGALLFWTIELHVASNNVCSHLCKKYGYTDSFSAMSSKSQPTTCTCMKEDKDNKYVLQINMNTGEQLFFKIFPKKSDSNKISTTD